MASGLLELTSAAAVHTLAQWKITRTRFPRSSYVDDMTPIIRQILRDPNRVLVGRGATVSTARNPERVDRFNQAAGPGFYFKIATWVEQPHSAYDVMGEVLPPALWHVDEMLKDHRFVLADVRGSQLMYICRRSICRTILYADTDDASWTVRHVRKEDVIRFNKLKHLREWAKVLYFPR